MHGSFLLLNESTRKKLFYCLLFTVSLLSEGKEADDYQGGAYETAVNQEKKDEHKSHRELTDKSGRLKLETVDDLFNILQLKKRRRERKVPPEYVDEQLFLTAAMENKVPVVEKYLTDGGNPNAADHFQRTALHKASFKGHVDVMKRLLEAGAAIDKKDKAFCCFLYFFCINHQSELLSSPQLHSTPLHVAVRTGHCECAEHLIHCGADVNAKDRDGDTPMHDAVRINRFKMIRLLMMYGASLNTKNCDGKTPMETLYSWQNGAKISSTSEMTEPIY
uniref:Ankyrin repeat domain-containing protein 1 n=1 Tax=Labrus bergylta TaxID=56723 RepID=A0A3Q3EA84_9LABR